MTCGELMERTTIDDLCSELQRAVASGGSRATFPLDTAVQMALQQKNREQLKEIGADPALGDLLTLLDVTSVSAAAAIKGLASSGDDATGIRDALVDLWGRAEAARCLWLDSQTAFTGEEGAERVLDVWETARLLAPDAIAVAMRLSEPVAQYVEFASKVASAATTARG